MMTTTRYRKKLKYSELLSIWGDHMHSYMRKTVKKNASYKYKYKNCMELFNYLICHIAIPFSFSGRGHRFLRTAYNKSTELIKSSELAIKNNDDRTHSLNSHANLVFRLRVYQSEADYYKYNILATLSYHFPQDIVREICSKYI